MDATDLTYTSLALSAKKTKKALPVSREGLFFERRSNRSIFEEQGAEPYG
jgi:hypothetical protein